MFSVEAKDISNDFQLGKTLKPLLAFLKVQIKDILNPYSFRGALVVTIFICSAGSRTNGVWSLVEKASRSVVRLTEMEYPSLIKAISYYSDRVLIYVHPCFEKVLKLKYL